MVPLLRKVQAMYATVRKYSIIPGSVKEVMQRIEGGFLPIISEASGFLAYYALRVGANEVITISIFDTLAGAQESTPLAFDRGKHQDVRLRAHCGLPIVGQILVGP